MRLVEVGRERNGEGEVEGWEVIQISICFIVNKGSGYRGGYVLLEQMASCSQGNWACGPGGLVKR